MSEPERTIRFVASSPPPLTAGRYTLTVKQEVTEVDSHGAAVAGGTHRIYTSDTRVVHVQGQRFAIEPRDIQATFPGDGSSGDHGNEAVLPHITFTRPSLPWERSSGVPGSPWLALLVFHATDAGGLPAVVPAMLGDLTRQPFHRPGVAAAIEPRTSTLATAEQGGQRVIASYADIAKPGAWGLQAGEKPWDPCLVVDVPVALFQQIAPAGSELAWLAHARTTSGTASTEACSAVLANRLPQREGLSLACLVSLEDLAPVLPPARGISVGGRPATHLRLVVLKAWNFQCGAGLRGFHQPLSTGPLQSPYIRPDTETLQDKAVEHALAMGYTALDHNNRWGDETVSWYRGPLLPFSTRVGDSVPRPPIDNDGYLTGTLPLSSADEALRYDPDLGMLDVSYATAWQLGRLLALRDQIFARDLDQWKRQNRRKLIAPQPAPAAALALDFLQGILEMAALGLPAPATAPVRELLNDLGRLKARLGDTPAPDSVLRRLRSLRRLEGVPLDYLVPDERMLPPESLRFFQLDQNWAYSLVEGAYSISRADSAARQQDAATCPHDTYGQVSGFLLRSSLVSAWPTLQAEIEVSTASGVFRPLRCERITPDILLCMVEVEGAGVITSVTLQVPPDNVEYQLPRQVPWRQQTLTVVDIGRLAAGHASAAHFAGSLTGAVTATWAYDSARGLAVMRVDGAAAAELGGWVEWQFLVDGKPFRHATTDRSRATGHGIELDMALHDALPAGAIAVRLRPAATAERGRWMRSHTLQRAAAPEAQPTLRYRVGEDCITAVWAEVVDGPPLEVQLQCTSPHTQKVTHPGAAVPVQTLQARLPLGGDVLGTVQVRFRQAPPRAAEDLPGAWGTSTASLVRLPGPAYQGASFVNGVLKLQLEAVDNGREVSPAPDPTWRLQFRPVATAKPARHARAPGAATVVLTRHVQGRRAELAVQPNELPPGRYTFNACLLGIDDRVISSHPLELRSDAEPLKLLGHPQVSVLADGALSWPAIADAGGYRVVAHGPAGYREEHLWEPGMSALQQWRLAGTGRHRFTAQAFGVADMNWHGAFSTPVDVDLREP